MKVYIVYEIYGEYNGYEEWVDFSSRIDSVYIDKVKALKRATEIFNEAQDNFCGQFESSKKVWAEYGPESLNDIIDEYDAN